jgi:uncharacterized membrane protein
MLPIITSSFAGIISFMVLDYIFLAQIAKNFYLTKLASHITVKDGSLVPYLPAVPLVYIVAVLGIWVFILSKVTTLSQAFLYGALMGFVMYAFYDFTNLATLKDYPWSLTIVDIIWGTFLVGIVTSIMFLVKNAIA